MFIKKIQVKDLAEDAIINLIKIKSFEELRYDSIAMVSARKPERTM